MRADYRKWLEQQEYSPNTINTQTSHASRIEQAYGDLEDHFSADRFESISKTLRYSADDGRRGIPNPSKLPIGGDLYKSLASFRAAIGLYARFLAEVASESTPAPVPKLSEEGFGISRERIGLERDLQKALRRELGQLEPGLAVADDGVERPVASGFIDITARDSGGGLVVIELKAGTGDRSAVGQILSYMGDISEEEGTNVRGILVAHEFDVKAKSAARMVPNLSLRKYSVRFAFDETI